MAGSHSLLLTQVPDLIGLAGAYPRQFPFLLDNAAIAQSGGHSLLLFSRGEVLERQASGEVFGPGTGAGFLERLENWYESEKSEVDPALDPAGLEIPFIGGWFIYLGYEMAAEIEDCLNLPRSQYDLPDALACRCPGAVIIRHPEDSSAKTAPYAFLVAESRDVLLEMHDLLNREIVAKSDLAPELTRLQAEDPVRFNSAVLKILRYLRDGDVFQVNISRHWTGEFACAPDVMDLYRCLRLHNPAPFAGLMRWGDQAVLSSSPERLVELRGRRVQTRPIAGTRPRSADPDRDLALSRELIDNVKERAEHIMLIDLERNDLGRVCRPGTVEVSELMVIESYAHVHHIVSNVRGELTPEATPVDTLRAVFPGGTITGCPKVRCMEIISELEQVGRGFYTGSMGYLGINGNMDLNILIRSMLLHGRNISFRTGAGIVADSEPDLELQETQDKARGLLLALESECQEIGVA